MNLLDVLGWTGTIIVVGSYVAMRAGKIKQEGTFYELCNVLGPLMIAVDAWFHQLYSVVAVTGCLGHCYCTNVASELTRRDSQARASSRLVNTPATCICHASFSI